MNVVLIIPSVRVGRNADRVAKFVSKCVKENTSLKITTLDILKLDPSLKLNQTPLHFYPDPKDAPEWMRKTEETLRSADGFIVPTTEYNGQLPPALLNLLNSFHPHAYRHRPVAIVPYSMGATGGHRAMNSLRSFVGDLGMVVVPGYAVAMDVKGYNFIGQVDQVIDEDGNCKQKDITNDTNMLMKNLEWYCQALMSQKQTHGPPGSQ